MSCAKTAEPIDLLFGLWTRVGRRKHTSSIVFARWLQCAHTGGHIGITWLILLNRPLRRRCGLLSNYFDHLLLLKMNRLYSDIVAKSLLGHFTCYKSASQTLPLKSMAYKQKQNLSRPRRPAQSEPHHTRRGARGSPYFCMHHRPKIDL